MSTVEGFVTRIFTKQFTGRDNSVRTAYSIKVESPGTGEELPLFYQFGFSPPGFKEGDFIRFESEPTKNPKAEAFVQGSGSKPKNAPARVHRAAAAQQAAGNFSGGKKPWQGNPARDAQFAARDKHQTEYVQPRISYQAARNAAIELTNILLTHNALPVSKSPAKAGAALRYEEVIAVVDKLTVQFHNDTETLRKLQSVADAGAVDTGVPGTVGAKPESAPVEKDDTFGESEPVVTETIETAAVVEQADERF